MSHPKGIFSLLFFYIFLAGCGGSSNTGDSPPPEPPSPQIPPVSEESRLDAAREAFTFGFALVEMMNICDGFSAVNQLVRRSSLATADSNSVIRPNNDTLYTSACVYLGDDWVQISMPPASDRYQSVQVFDAYTETVAALGPNQIPASGTEFILTTPNVSGSPLPAGIPVIEVPTPYAFVLFRTLVEGPDDLIAADNAQGLIQLHTNASTTPDRSVPSSTGSSADTFYLNLMRRLNQNPPSLLEENLVDSFAIAGIIPSNNPNLNDVSIEQRNAWETAYTEGLVQLDNTPIGTRIGSWRFVNPRVANPGTDYLLRAIVAKHGIFPQPYDEAIYASTRGDGAMNLVLHLPPNWQPVSNGGFWSLTLYNQQGFLVDNAINRYSIGNRTPGLNFENDDSLRLFVQCTDPGGDRSANWLPAPCGPYSVTMRMYLPNNETRSPSFMLPPLSGIGFVSSPP